MATGSCDDPTAIQAHLGDLARRGYALVRLYDVPCPLGDYVQAAADHGLKLMLGINSIANLETDLGSLISMLSEVSWEPVQSVYIGNELVNTGVASATDVADAVVRAREILSAAGYIGDVATVDTAGQFISHPELCQTSSFCAVNIHAFFDAQATAETAGPRVRQTYNSVQNALAAAGIPQTIIITESGWPRQGNANGVAVPSIENQRTALQSILTEFVNDMPQQLMLFQARDATYKSPGQFGVEPYWGIYDDTSS